MSRAPITISIDRVVLRGVEPMQAKAIVEGLRTELASVFSSPALRAQLYKGGNMGVIRVGSVQLNAGGAGARRFGGVVARAVGKGMRT